MGNLKKRGFDRLSATALIKEAAYDVLNDVRGSQKGRKTNGLVELTKKFIRILIESPQQCLDLNNAMEDLKV